MHVPQASDIAPQVSLPPGASAGPYHDPNASVFVKTPSDSFYVLGSTELHPQRRHPDMLRHMLATINKNSGAPSLPLNVLLLPEASAGPHRDAQASTFVETPSDRSFVLGSPHVRPPRWHPDMLRHMLAAINKSTDTLPLLVDFPSLSVGMPLL
jgi:hypothetical protein